MDDLSEGGITRSFLFYIEELFLTSNTKEFDLVLCIMLASSRR